MATNVEVNSTSSSAETGGTHGDIPFDVYCWGYNECGQLGLGDNKNRNTPQHVTALADKNVSSVSCGYHHTAALLYTREVYCWGYNGDGQLGLGDKDMRNTPQHVTALQLKNVSSVSCGGRHTMALLSGTGEVYCWGWNERGQLGLGDNEDRNTPQHMTALNNLFVSSVSCGGQSTFALLRTGEVYCWGINSGGQLGLGDDNDRNTPQHVTALDNMNISSVYCDDHTVALMSTGDVYCWGCNYFGQLGLGDLNNRYTPQHLTALVNMVVSSVSCGDNHTVALLNTGEVYCWGDNNSGQLGLGDKDMRITPQHVTALQHKNVSSVSCGCYHTVALLRTGELYCWGKNEYGQLGLGDDYKRNTPQHVTALNNLFVSSVSCGGYHTAALIKKQ